MALKRTDVKDWDDEELQYGRRRDKNGNLVGRPPSYIPKACHDELHRRMRSKAEYLMTKAIPEIIPELIKIAKADKPALPDQIRAINMLLDRTMGKPVEHVQMTVEEPWKDAIAIGIVGALEEESRGQTIDVDVVEDDTEVEWE